MNIEDKLTILADAAKYDVSCASSGSRRKSNGPGLGNAVSSGICHSYTEDGRCVSLLKILFTNFCIFNCAYCINRSGNDVPRAAFTPQEVVRLTMDFYRRNYIEGLFLSSGILKSPDDTMERLVRTAHDLRMQGFNGYIHLKCVPFTSPRLIHEAGQAADRLSINIELPSEKSLKRLTRDKTFNSVLEPMGVIREKITETRENQKQFRHVPAFSPAGQSTQLIVGASPESDFDILSLSKQLYRQQSLKRVYYSSYIPVGQLTSPMPQIKSPPLVRENRLYQADWLMRLYGFSIHEIISREEPFLDLNIDPKQAFAMRHPERFPVDINTADRNLILKVPGIGLRSAERILNLRRSGRIRLEHLKQLGVAVSRAKMYVRCDGSAASHWCGASLNADSPSSVPRNTDTAFYQSAVRDDQLIFEPDGSFEGLLTAIFEAYAAEFPPDVVDSGGKRQLGLFERRVKIRTDPQKSERVWNGLRKHLGNKQRQQVHDAYLSGVPGAENAIYQHILNVIPGRNTQRRSGHISSYIRIEKLAQSVRRDAHRMKGFVRFQHAGGGQYLALIEPRYDILPLIREHFEARFANQKWIIYDTGRDYGLSYNGRQTCEIKLDSSHLKVADGKGSDNEKQCQILWQRYFTAVNIAERTSPERHRQLLPKRYWRYLTEKQEPGRSFPDNTMH